MKSYLIITPLLIALCSALAYYVGSGKFISQKKVIQQEEVSKLNHVLELIENRYVDSVKKNELIELTIKNMLAELDPHSAYISAVNTEVENERLQGHFGGVGIRFIVLRDTLMVTNIIKGGPSDKAGLLASDRIIAVDDSVIAGVGLAIENVHKKLKGKSGTPVHLTILREGTEKEIDIIRGQIPLPSINASYQITDDIGYIKIDNFSNKTGVEFAQALGKLKRKGMTKLILDLRHNGGGYMHTAVNVVDEFLPDGKLIVYTQGLHLDKNETFASAYGNFENNAVVVLINSSSASASEIVSGALQDNDRATIIGRRSFGKGLVQQPMILEDGSEMRLTVSRYYTPTGRCIQKAYGDGIDYHSDIMERYENGELQELDSSHFENLEQFTTPKGKIVYGGGGIMPDIFVPIDTTGSSLYLTSLLYSSAFRNFCFNYIDKNRKQLRFNDVENFNKNFKITEELLNQFTDFAEKEYDIPKIITEFQHSKERIKINLKAEIATYLFDVSTRSLINIPFDKDIQEALKQLK
ncbi:MAG: S41 family peptidase [Flavobacteriales bacterium]|jgi:carboxyl-terminal processing protease|nr:S41 family peptidase [Flavobacteriales bacterium]